MRREKGKYMKRINEAENIKSKLKKAVLKVNKRDLINGRHTENHLSLLIKTMIHEQLEEAIKSA